MAADTEKLDGAKQKHLNAKEEIERLRQTIAADTCPPKRGDIVIVVDDSKEYEGHIDHYPPHCLA